MAAIVQVGYEDDADDFSAARIRAGALLDYASELSHYGFALQNTHYSAGGWSTDAPALIGLYRNQRRDTLQGVRAEGGLVRVEGHTRVVGDATWSLRPRPTTGVELILAGDLVGTQQALEEGIAYGLLGVSVEQQFGPRFTGVVMTAWQPFTDDNSRTLLRARMIWSALPEQGLSVQARWRQYSSGDSDVPGAYFNPDRYRTWDAVLSLRRRVGGESPASPAAARSGSRMDRGNPRAWPKCVPKDLSAATCTWSAVRTTATPRASPIRRTTGTGPPASA